jgi:hypothetical protein
MDKSMILEKFENMESIKNDDWIFNKFLKTIFFSSVDQTLDVVFYHFSYNPQPSRFIF